MKILYLHGLESKLNDNKRSVLKRYGEIIAPDLDYSTDSNIIQTLYTKYQNQDVDVILGSSMGGFTGFYLAAQLGVPALLFNPALSYRSTVQEVPDQMASFARPVHIVLGVLDPIIKYSDTRDFLRQHHIEHDVTVHLREDLEHQIPLHVFDEEVNLFFNAL
ncbi:MAG TPA: YqiA/YcfP family alpha/beta fold hydrolase [Flavobacterium sp.]|jgi:hypothetical protein